MAKTEQFGGRPRPDQTGQNQEIRGAKKDVLWNVLEKYGDLNLSSKSGQAFEQFAGRAWAKVQYEEAKGANSGYPKELLTKQTARLQQLKEMRSSRENIMQLNMLRENGKSH